MFAYVYSVLYHIIFPNIYFQKIISTSNPQPRNEDNTK